jgi:hypothetical protein
MKVVVVALLLALLLVVGTTAGKYCFLNIYE